MGRGLLDVTIQEHKFSLRSEYDITAGAQVFTAQKALVSLLNHLELMNEGGAVVATMQGRFSLIHFHYDFSLRDGRSLAFVCEKAFKGVYTCTGLQGPNYTLYRNRGVRYSIFEGDVQVAAATRNHVIWGKGNEYDMKVNSDADVVVLVCMMLALNTEENDDNQDTVTYDFGSIGPEERPFDESWVPK